MAVVIGEAAIAIRGDASGAADEIQDEVVPAAEKAGDEAGDKLSEKMKLGLAAGLAGLGAGFAAALEQEALGDKLAAQLGGSDEYAAEMGGIAGDLYAGAYGESLGEVNDALRTVLQSGLLPEDATNAQIESITGRAMSLASTFDQDVAGAAAAAGRMVQTGLAANAEEALDIVTRGFQQGADSGGDFLDVLGEYGTTFTELGVTGAQATGLIDQALAAGIPNADFAADALREMGIIGREAGDDAAAALDSLGLSSADYFSAMQEGGPAASAALDTVLDSLRGQEDPALRASAAAALVGTQYEDLGDAILQMDPSEAASRLGTLEGAAADLDETVGGNAQASLTSFWRTLQTGAVDVIGGQVIPVVQSIVGWLRDELGPALTTVGGFITDNVVPPLQSLIGWLGENDAVVSALSWTIGTVLVAALGVWGTRSLLEAGKNILAWFTTAASSQAGAATQQRSALQVVAGWIMMGAQALWQGLKIAAVWAVQIAQAAVTGAASFMMQVGRVVGGWILMSGQALLAAGRMALAWLIAMGPIGLIILAVAGLVTLIVVYFDEIVAAISAAWEWVKSAAAATWEWIKNAVSAAVDFLVNLFLNFTLVGLIIKHWDTIKNATSKAWNAVVSFVTGIPGRLVSALSSLGSKIASVASSAWRAFDNAVDTGVAWVISTVKGLPGKILSALSGLGSLLVNAGGDLIRGLVNGISSAASFVGDVAGSIFRAVRGFINEQVIDRLNGFLEFTIMGVTVNPPDIPRLHSGGVFDSGSGEGLALLRDQERVITPEQRVIADRLLGDLLGGTLTAAAAAPGTAGGTAVQIDVHASPGMSVGELSAHVANDLSWSLATGAGNLAPALAGSAL